MKFCKKIFDYVSGCRRQTACRLSGLLSSIFSNESPLENLFLLTNLGLFFFIFVVFLRRQFLCFKLFFLFLLFYILFVEFPSEKIIILTEFGKEGEGETFKKSGYWKEDDRRDVWKSGNTAGQTGCK